MLSEEILAIQQELKTEAQKRADIEKQCREKVEQLKTKLQQERKLNAEANRTLEQLNSKVRELETKCGKELEYYKQACQDKDEEIRERKDRLEKALERANYRRLELTMAVDRLDAESHKLKGMLVDPGEYDKNSVAAINKV